MLFHGQCTISSGAVKMIAAYQRLTRGLTWESLVGVSILALVEIL